MDKDTSEIAKLTERISRDPKSKLFVSLAEEYKKTGDMEMAIHVLTEGLKNNPSYVTARSLLGRLLLEKGDLAGAQRELEEAVKAVPDNLMAQRKLGDVYAVQGKKEEALKHYHTALSLNPGDGEVASLVADLEAGVDISGKIHIPRPSPVPEETSAKQTAPGPSLAPSAAPAPSAAVPKPASVPASVVPEQEEPEEVIVVEPLEPESPHATERSEHDFLAEQANEPAPGAEAERSEFSFGVVETGRAAQEVTAGEEQPLPSPGGEKETTRPGEGAGKEDDFTTDTLAELYIAQGFYEKAIDIYQRMLADNPNSQGLKDKLDRVRAMGSQDSGEKKREQTPGIDQEYVPKGGEAEMPERAGLGTGFDEFVPPPTAEPKQTKDVSADFEPVEYMPPNKEPLPAGEEAVPQPSKAAGSGRKETIDRLENWLKNIMKEK